MSMSEERSSAQVEVYLRGSGSLLIDWVNSSDLIRSSPILISSFVCAFFSIGCIAFADSDSQTALWLQCFIDLLFMNAKPSSDAFGLRPARLVPAPAPIFWPLPRTPKCIPAPRSLILSSVNCFPAGRFSFFHIPLIPTRSLLTFVLLSSDSIYKCTYSIIIWNRIVSSFSLLYFSFNLRWFVWK